MARIGFTGETGARHTIDLLDDFVGLTAGTAIAEAFAVGQRAERPA